MSLYNPECLPCNFFVPLMLNGGQTDYECIYTCQGAVIRVFTVRPKSNKRCNKSALVLVEENLIMSLHVSYNFS